MLNMMEPPPPRLLCEGMARRKGFVNLLSIEVMMPTQGWAFAFSGCRTLRRGRGGRRMGLILVEAPLGGIVDGGWMDWIV